MRRNRALYYTGQYVLRGLQLTTRQRFITVAAILVMVPLMFFVYLTLAFNKHADMAAQKVDDQLKISVTISEGADRKSAVSPQLLAAQVRKLPNVRGVKIVSEAQARARFLAKTKLPATAVPNAFVFKDALEVNVQDTSAMEPVRRQILQLQGVDSAIYIAKLVRNLTGFSKWLQYGAIGLAAIFAIVALATVWFIVRTSIYMQRRAVRTMAQVGGSRLTIAVPLLVHMFVVVLIAATIACIAGYFADPLIGSAKVSNLPDWLRTGRAYGLFTLLPFMTTGVAAAVASIVAFSTWRHAR